MLRCVLFLFVSLLPHLVILVWGVEASCAAYFIAMKGLIMAITAVTTTESIILA